MARKRHSDEDILKLLREIEVKLSAGSNVQSTCRGAGISDATYYRGNVPRTRPFGLTLQTPSLLSINEF